jgi:hypothetical protein
MCVSDADAQFEYLGDSEASIDRHFHAVLNSLRMCDALGQFAIVFSIRNTEDWAAHDGVLCEGCRGLPVLELVLCKFRRGATESARTSLRKHGCVSSGEQKDGDNGDTFEERHVVM